MGLQMRRGEPGLRERLRCEGWSGRYGVRELPGGGVEPRRGRNACGGRAGMGQRRDTYLNPTDPSIGDGQDAGQVIDVTSTRSTPGGVRGGRVGDSQHRFRSLIRP